MDDGFYISRTLWYEEERKKPHNLTDAAWSEPASFSHEKTQRHTLTDDQLLAHSGPLIILGEAGMGKSTLLRWLANKEKTHRCVSARSVIAGCKISASITHLMIDALDEVSDTDPIAKILEKLQDIECTQVMLSCRAADWHHGAHVGMFADFGLAEPLVLHLQPFSEEDSNRYLIHKQGDAACARIMEHFQHQGLMGLLGNPQTLLMIGELSLQQPLPTTKQGLYQATIEKLALEHNESKARTQLSQAAVIDAAGAAFAGLLLTGKEAISTKAAANVGEHEISLSALKNWLDDEAIKTVMGSRLFATAGTDCFYYTHRSMGEYLAAQWLSKHANTSRKRQRLLSALLCEGGIPASLRGLHAWLVQDNNLAPAVIKNDPLGLLQYADISSFSVQKISALLDVLKQYARKNNDYMHWVSVGIVRPLAQEALLPQLRAIISDHNQFFGFRVIVIRAFVASPLTSRIQDTLCALLLNLYEKFSVRREACKVLAASESFIDWADMLKILSRMGDECSSEIVGKVMTIMIEKGIDTASIAELLLDNTVDDYLTWENISCALVRSLQDHQLTEILDQLAAQVKNSSDKRAPSIAIYGLLPSVIDSELYSVEKLWDWIETLKPCYNDAASYAEKQVNDLIAGQPAFRSALYQHVLLSPNPQSNDIASDYGLLKHFLPALTLNEDDIRKLLGQLNPEDTQDRRWQTLVNVYHADTELSQSVYQAILPFAQHCSSDRAWLKQWEQFERNNIGLPRGEADQIKSYCQQHIAELERGESRCVVKLIRGFLSVYSDHTEPLPSQEYLVNWLGGELAETILCGFERYLHSPLFSANEIAQKHANGCYGEEEDVYVFVLVAYLVHGMDLYALSDEVILRGWYILQDNGFAINTQPLKERLTTIIQHRSLWVQAHQNYIEPRLKSGLQSSIIEGFMEGDLSSESITQLAVDWLLNVPRLDTWVGRIVLTRLFEVQDVVALQHFVSEPQPSSHQSVQNYRLAVALIIDFEATLDRMGNQPVDANLIQCFIDLPIKKITHDLTNQPHYQRMHWIIRTFRPLFPTDLQGQNFWVGDFIEELVRNLAKVPTQEAFQVLQQLADDPEDGYSLGVTNALYQQQKEWIENHYKPMALASVRAIFQDDAPKDMADLQTCVRLAFDNVQAKITADDANSWRGFYADAKPANSQKPNPEEPYSEEPYSEECCRDYLLGLLRQGDSPITWEPERQVAGAKRVDITATVGALRLPIEIKGQWHRDLWTAADEQLDALYTTDWQAQGRGVYLVLWFGHDVIKSKRLKKPPKPHKTPATAAELQKMLEAGSLACQQKRVAVYVLDMSKNTASGDAPHTQKTTDDVLCCE